MNALLIYPKFPEKFWSFTYALGFIGEKTAFPPRGLLSIAPLLPTEWSKLVVDLNVNRLSDKDLAWADMVFIDGMAVHLKSAKKTIARCKAAGLTVVAGGPVLKAEPDEFRKGSSHSQRSRIATSRIFVRPAKRATKKAIELLFSGIMRAAIYGINQSHAIRRFGKGKN